MQDSAPAPECQSFQLNSVSKARRFVRIAFLFAVSIAVGATIPALLMIHQGPWAGFLWDFLFRLPFLLLCVAFVIQFVRSIHSGDRKGAAKALPVLIFFGLITSIAWFEFVRHVRSIVHFHQLQPLSVRQVKLACHTTADPISFHQIVMDLKRAQWFSPDSHGWSPYADLSLEFADGHTENYPLTKILADGRLVIKTEGTDSGLLAIPHLSESVQQTGLLKYKGFYQAIVPFSVCKQNSAMHN
jgi:hypothetical protein